MSLANVYDYVDHERVLYDLLKERDGREDINISHERMPTFDEHQEFVRSRPYRAWYLIFVEDAVVGSIYLTRKHEVGVFVFKNHQGKGIGRAAVDDLRRRWPGRMLANCNPRNERSRALFEWLGGRVVQVTYEL